MVHYTILFICTSILFWTQFKWKQKRDLNGGLEKYYKGEKMSEDEYRAVRNYHDWLDDQKEEKNYEDWE